ncbi:hypothetical protein NQ314_017095 [Rhamnusium bicolor]|uniref:Uncharacterized protein n=1 Tax=Rhamnusium bicolor TaxID=1586634 RepID=A0AAV8WTQ1_9CUCU|nr:hypothetical protein NQ314_017095 [Rhamnusium bicolor]
MSSDLSICLWKARLRQAFPRQNDFAVSLEKLIARRRLSTEKVTTYYHAKLALCGQCGVVGEKAVSFIIRGLPKEMRANAYACRCATPEALYSEFLAGLEGYQTPVAAGSSKRGDRLSTGSGSRKPGNTSPSSERRAVILRKENLRYFNGQKLGHFSGECSEPRKERCSRANKQAECIKRCVWITRATHQGDEILIKLISGWLTLKAKR